MSAGEGHACADGGCDGIRGMKVASWRSYALRGRLYELEVCTVLLGSCCCCPGPGQPRYVLVQGDHREILWASGRRASPSGRPGSAGYRRYNTAAA